MIQTDLFRVENTNLRADYLDVIITASESDDNDDKKSAYMVTRDDTYKKEIKLRSLPYMFVCATYSSLEELNGDLQRGIVKNDFTDKKKCLNVIEVIKSDNIKISRIR